MPVLERVPRELGRLSPGELRGPPRPRLRQSLPEFCIRCNPPQCRDHRRRIARIETERCITGDAHDGLDIRTRRRYTGRHRFHHRDAKALEQRRIEECPRPGVEFVQFLARNPTGKIDRIDQAERSAQFVQRTGEETVQPTNRQAEFRLLAVELQKT